MRSRPTYWDKVRKELRPKFNAVGLLNQCELKWENCTGTKFLTFAHSLRRNEIDKYKKQGDEESYEEKMREVIRACSECHKELDANKRPITYEIVRNVIASRKKPVK